MDYYFTVYVHFHNPELTKKITEFICQLVEKYSTQYGEETIQGYSHYTYGRFILGLGTINQVKKDRWFSSSTNPKFTVVHIS